MTVPLDCTICPSRWFSARYREDARHERCPDCGGPLVRADEEPVVRTAAQVASARTVEFDRIGRGPATA